MEDTVNQAEQKEEVVVEEQKHETEVSQPEKQNDGNSEKSYVKIAPKLARLFKAEQGEYIREVNDRVAEILINGKTVRINKTDIEIL